MPRGKGAGVNWQNHGQHRSLPGNHRIFYLLATLGESVVGNKAMEWRKFQMRQRAQNILKDGVVMPQCQH